MQPVSVAEFITVRFQRDLAGEAADNRLFQ